MKSERIYDGRIVGLRVDTVEMEDKKYAKREIVEHPGGVGIIAINDNNEIVLVEQFRKAAENSLIEIPAGTMEPNEEPRTTAKRELEEETGYTAEKWTYLGEFYPTPGYCTEKHHLFMAEDLNQGEAHPDEGEILEPMLVDFEKALEMVKYGKIIDAKTVLAILTYAQFFKR